MSHSPKELPKRLRTALRKEQEAHLDTIREFDDFMFEVAALIRRLDQYEEGNTPLYQEEWERVVDLLMKQGYQLSELRGNYE